MPFDHAGSSCAAWPTTGSGGIINGQTSDQERLQETLTLSIALRGLGRIIMAWASAEAMNPNVRARPAAVKEDGEEDGMLVVGSRPLAMHAGRVEPGS